MESTHFSPKRMSMSFKRYFLNTVLPILGFGGLIGTTVGVVVWAYNYGAEKITEMTTGIYENVFRNLWFLPLLLLGLAALAVLVSFIVKFIPEIKGSGIPYTEGVMRGQLRYRTLRVLLGTIVSSFISFLAGLPLGGEGPSVQIGGVIGQGVDEVATKVSPNAKAFNRLAITGGASAGLAVAFNAPLTGIIFALEEGHKRFSPTIFLTSASSVLFATFVSRLLRVATGSSFDFYMFQMETIELIPFRMIWILFILGILIGLASAAFSQLLSYTKILLDKIKIPTMARLISAFLLVGIVGVFLPDIIGGGSGLIKKITSQLDFAVQMLIILLVVKLILIALCSNSGTTGGLFVPMLAVGALFGAVFGHLFMACGMPQEYYNTIVIIAMCAFMGGVVRAPLTAMILIVEITGQLFGFFESGIAICLAYFVVELLAIQPLYDRLLEGTLHNEHRGQERQIVTYEISIEDGSFASGRSVRDILWPSGCIVQKIIKMNKEGQIVSRMDKDGERLIHPGDVYIIQAETYDEARLKEEIDVLVLNPKTLKKPSSDAPVQ